MYTRNFVGKRAGVGDVWEKRRVSYEGSEEGKLLRKVGEGCVGGECCAGCRQMELMDPSAKTV